MTRAEPPESTLPPQLCLVSHAPRPIGTTELSPAGLLKHLTGVERFRFTIDIAAENTECSIVAEHSLDTPAKSPDLDFDLRYAVTHLIEETARHLSHLDLLREAIDGQRGE